MAKKQVNYWGSIYEKICVPWLVLTIWYDDTLFGENWNDDSIDLKTRCIITVVALMSSRMTDKSLKYNLKNVKKTT